MPHKAIIGPSISVTCCGDSSCFLALVELAGILDFSKRLLLHSCADSLFGTHNAM